MGKMKSIPAEVSEILKFYVYRLIDPRNGETFYVGKGSGNRLFQHATGAMAGEEAGEGNILDPKTDRIREILRSGLEIIHVVQRHGMDNNTAFEVEAALIDAYPGLTNNKTGTGSADYGVSHIDTIVRAYSAEEFVPRHKILAISVNLSLKTGRPPYEAVSCAWVLDPRRAKGRLVLAHQNGLVVSEGVFESDQWIEATKASFPLLESDLPGRWGFKGELASDDIRRQYEGKRIPSHLRKQGAANPIRYIDPKLETA